MSMKTIKVKRDTKSMLNELRVDSDRNVDDVIVRLLGMVDEDMKSVDWLVGDINVNVSEDTLKLIKEYRIQEHESYDSILRRAISLYLNR